MDQQRLSLLLAVLEKRAGLNLIGRRRVRQHRRSGMTIDEPASDLGVLAAIASSVRNRVIAPTTVVFGEVGLAGEVRGIAQATSARPRSGRKWGFFGASCRRRTSIPIRAHARSATDCESGRRSNGWRSARRVALT